MSVIFGIIFLILFAIILVAISLGIRFLEHQRRQQVKGVLKVASGDDQGPETSILIDRKQPDVLDEMLHKMKFGQKLQRSIQLAGLDWTVGHLVALMLLFGVAGGFLVGLVNPFGYRLLSVVAAAAVFACLPYLFLLHKRSQRLRQMEEQLPQALDFLARSMRAGHAFSISLEMVGQELPDPLGMEFRTLFNEQNLGAPLEVAFQNFSYRVPLLDVRLFVSSVLLQRQTGGNLSEILVRLAQIIRERFRLRGQVRAASAHGRLTALILTALPIVLVIALMILVPAYLPLLAHDPDGKWLLAGAAVAQVLGYFIMRRITDIKV
jgi:tight adherence protein B